jgi:hypothetical protein
MLVYDTSESGERTDGRHWQNIHKRTDELYYVSHVHNSV